MKSIFSFLILSILSLPLLNAQTVIMVNKGHFESVTEAAKGELKVNFFDTDPADDRSCTECFAATELAEFLPEAAGINPDNIKFVQPGDLPASGDIFIIGSRHSNTAVGKFSVGQAMHLETEQSYCIRSFEDNDRTVTIIEGSDRTGSLYGVYRYLELLGIRFIGPGENGTVLPQVPSKVQAGLNISENPAYLTRGFYTWGDRKTGIDFFLWMARNRFNYWTVQNQPYQFLKKLGIKLSDGGHRIQGIVFNSDDEYPYNHPLFKGDENKPRDPHATGNEYTGDADKNGKLTMFEAHPEWYGLRDGKRVKIALSDDAAQRGINFCTSNADARKEFARRILRQLTDGQWRFVDVFEFWMFDGGANLWCSCENCRAAGSFTDNMFLVSYDILKSIEREQKAGTLKRRVEVSSIAYHGTLEPPTRPFPADYDYKNSSILFAPIGRCYVHNFADPSCTEINQSQLKAYQGWTMGENRFYQGPVFMCEYYNVSAFKSLPVVLTRRIAVDVPWFYNTGTNQFLYMHTPTELLGTWNINQYLLGKMLWNVKEDALKILNEFYSLYYPSTFTSTREFYEHLEAATANLKVFKHYVETANQKNYSLSGRLLKGDPFQLEHMHLEEYHPLLNDGTDVEEMMDEMEMARKYIDISLIKCTDPVEKERLLEDKDRFDYGYTMYRYIYHLIRTSVFHRKGDKVMAQREFALADRYAGDLKNIVSLVRVSSEHSNAANGFEATQSVSVFNEFRKLYGKTER